jgi:hypothetical protein
LNLSRAQMLRHRRNAPPGYTKLVLDNVEAKASELLALIKKHLAKFQKSGFKTIKVSRGGRRRPLSAACGGRGARSGALSATCVIRLMPPCGLTEPRGARRCTPCSPISGTWSSRGGAAGGSTLTSPRTPTWGRVRQRTGPGTSTPPRSRRSWPALSSAAASCTSTPRSWALTRTRCA